MDVGGGAESVNSWMGSVFQAFCGARDVLFRSATERSDFNFTALGRDGPDGVKVTFRSDRESGLNDVDAEILELRRHPNLLSQIHRAAGRLFAVAQGCIKDADSVLWHGVPPRGQANEDATEGWPRSQSYNL